MMTAFFLSLMVVAAVELPTGSSPEPLILNHFPDALHAFVWRNWEFVPMEKMAKVLGCGVEEVRGLGHAMGLKDPEPVSEEQWKRSYITIIRRNWHLLPYEQLLTLLEWTPEEMAYTLREDDFLWVKLGFLKPNAKPLAYSTPDERAKKMEGAIAATVRREFPDGLPVKWEQKPFEFIQALSEKSDAAVAASTAEYRFKPRYCTSYFTMYGDPLMDEGEGSYPEGYLQKLSASGVDGVWMQAVLYKLTPFPWQPELSEGYEKRLENLRALVARAKKYGIKVYLYLNEPRAMPDSFYEKHPELKGAGEPGYSALCTSVPEVRDYLRGGIESICRAAPDLGGFFSISASENLTNCYSQFRGKECPRCGKRAPDEVVSECLNTFYEGIQASGTKCALIAWDWGWQDEWVEGMAARLHPEISHMSVSEWSIPFERNGENGVIGEYSISVIGPGPRAKRNWGLMREKGHPTLAKIQAGTTWECGAVPYIPAVENVARHAMNLFNTDINGIMLGWTLGGYPSPNLEVVAEMSREKSVDESSIPKILQRVAERRYGPGLAPAITHFWRQYSKAFSEFPFSGATVYNAPLQTGPSNLLWEKSSGYRATMVGIAYDDLDGWRGNFTAPTFVKQFEKMADGMDVAIHDLKAQAAFAKFNEDNRKAFQSELDVAETVMLHYRSTAMQSRFILARDSLASATPGMELKIADNLRIILEKEKQLARRMYTIQTRDSRMGYEATNHYWYTRMDLAEKVLNCDDLEERWIPSIKNQAPK